MSGPLDRTPLVDYMDGKTLPLPAELRLDIYDLVFDGLYLHIDIPNRFPQESTANSPHTIRSDASKNAHVPGLLAVSKTTRDEALVRYTWLLPPVFHCPSLEWESRPGSVLPNTLLQNASLAYIANFNITGVDNELMPNLKMLCIGGPPTGSTEGIIHDLSHGDPQIAYRVYMEHYLRYFVY